MPLTPEALAFLDREVLRNPGTVLLGKSRLPIPSTEVLLAHLVIHSVFEMGPAGHLSLLSRQLFPGREVLEQWWRTGHGPSNRVPQLPLEWACYLLSKAGQSVAPRSRREDLTLAALRELRRLRSGDSGRR